LKLELGNLTRQRMFDAVPTNSNNDDDIDIVNLECLIDRIQVMCRQEDLHYAIISINDKQRLFTDKYREVFVNVMDWRSKMILYFYQITDFCCVRHESVLVAISYLDRFLWGNPYRKTTSLSSSSSRVKQARMSALKDGKVYQLVAITCLYVAIKVTETEPIDIESISELLQDTYSPIQIEVMEAVLLEGLQWYMHPPTSMSFLNELANFITMSKIRALTSDTTFFELATRQIEISSLELDLIGSKSSWIACSAILNALKILCIPKYQVAQIEEFIHQVLQLDNNTMPLIQNQKHQHVLPQQSIVILNSRIEIREIRRNYVDSYEEIDVVLNEDIVERNHNSSSKGEQPTTGRIITCLSQDYYDSTSNTGSPLNAPPAVTSSSLPSSKKSLIDVQDCLYDRIAMMKGLRRLS
jgi:Cyclin, N-terminal domain/Cyclin, C-terminal domain